MTAVEVRITDGDAAQYNDLLAWLNANRDIRGKVTPVAAPAKAGGLGDWVDVLEVAVGSGGVGVVLARSLALWLRNQRADLTITVSRGSETISVNASRVADPQAMLEEVLRSTDGA